eukprot:2384458-Rhodomonas_salina.3
MSLGHVQYRRMSRTPYAVPGTNLYSFPGAVLFTGTRQNYVNRIECPTPVWAHGYVAAVLSVVESNQVVPIPRRNARVTDVRSPRSGTCCGKRHASEQSVGSRASRRRRSGRSMWSGGSAARRRRPGAAVHGGTAAVYGGTAAVYGGNVSVCGGSASVNGCSAGRKAINGDADSIHRRGCHLRYNRHSFGLNRGDRSTHSLRGVRGDNDLSGAVLRYFSCLEQRVGSKSSTPRYLSAHALAMQRPVLTT